MNTDPDFIRMRNKCHEHDAQFHPEVYGCRRWVKIVCGIIYLAVLGFVIAVFLLSM